MGKPEVFITRRIPDAGLNLLYDYCEVDLWEGQMPPSREIILERIAGKAGILALLTAKIDAKVMDAAPNLKVISNFAVGFDNIDILAATTRGIVVGNTPDVLTETSADLAFALLMAAARRLSEGEKYVHAGQWHTWEPTLLLGQDIYDTTLGIIGLGRIGQAVAQRARGFNMRVIYYGGSNDETASKIGAEKVDFKVLLRESDFISIHTPLNDKTHHLINADALSQMKPTAILINTARGPIVDPKALYNALRSGIITAAALDVTEPEPIHLDDPLLTLDNCLIVPHIGSGSVSTRDKMAQTAAHNLIAGIKGERLPHCVNTEVYG